MAGILKNIKNVLIPVISVYWLCLTLYFSILIIKDSTIDINREILSILTTGLVGLIGFLGLEKWEKLKLNLEMEKARGALAVILSEDGQLKIRNNGLVPLDFLETRNVERDYSLKEFKGSLLDEKFRKLKEELELKDYNFPMLQKSILTPSESIIIPMKMSHEGLIENVMLKLILVEIKYVSKNEIITQHVYIYRKAQWEKFGVEKLDIVLNSEGEVDNNIKKLSGGKKIVESNVSNYMYLNENHMETDESKELLGDNNGFSPGKFLIIRIDREYKSMLPQD